MAVRVGGRFDSEKRMELVERLRAGPGEAARQEANVSEAGPPPSRWTLRTIRASFRWLCEYTLSGVWRLLRRFGLTLQRASVQQYSPDPDYRLKADYAWECVRHAAHRPATVVALFLDEMGFYRWPEVGTDWGAEPREAERQGTKQQQWRLIGALNAITGQVTHLDGYIVGRAKVISLYRHIADAYADAQRIYVIQDNWSIHKHPDVMTALTDLPRIEPVWLPTYAPWLNPIEKLWRWVRQDVLTLHRCADNWAELKQRVRSFLDQFAHGSRALQRYVGLLGDGFFARALRVA